MELSLRVSLEKIKQMEKVERSTPMGSFMWENLRMTSVMEREFTKILMEEGTKVSGLMISSMVKGRRPGIMEQRLMKVTSSWAKSMEKESLCGQMVLFMKVIL